MPSIDDVRRFWDANPLHTDVGNYPPGSREFFDHHTALVLAQNGGAMHPAFTPVCQPNDPILSLGCGIGFWLPWYWQRGFRNLTAADISSNSLELAKRRAVIYEVTAEFGLQNAEALTFPDNTFAHIECHGVIHHSPNPQASIDGIFRILKPGGRAVVTVYYKEPFLTRLYPMLRPFGRALFKLAGRGREKMFDATSFDELVRMYDGSENPVGTSYTTEQFKRMLPVKATPFYFAFLTHFFPMPIVKNIRAAPLMIGAVLEKPTS